MKLNFQVAEIESSTLLDSRTASVSLNPVILHVLSRDLYQKHIESPFREILINAIDAHIEAKTDRPVEIHLPTAWDENFYIRDYGPGLSHEMFMDIYLDYGNSQRRDDNERHGGLGLGTKSPLAYTNSFMVDSFYNGEKRTYIIYYNEDNMPQVSLLSKEDTEKPNGLKVAFTLVNGTDYYQFQQSAKTLLARIPKDKWNIINNNTIGLSLKDEDFIFPIFNKYGKIKLLPKNDKENLRIQMGYVAYKLETSTVLEFLKKKKDLSFKISREDGVTQLFSAHEIINNLTNSFCVEIESEIGYYPVHPSREYVNITPKTVKQLVEDIQGGLEELFAEKADSISNDIEKYKLTGVVLNKSSFKIRAKYFAQEYTWNSYVYGKRQINVYKDLIEDISTSPKTVFQVAYLSKNDFTDYMSDNRSRRYQFPNSFPADKYGLLIVDKESTDEDFLELLKEYEEVDLSEDITKFKKERDVIVSHPKHTTRTVVKSLQDTKHNVQILKTGFYGQNKHAWDSAEHSVDSLKALNKKIFWVATYNGNILKNPDATQILKKYLHYKKYFPSWKEPIVIGLPASKGTKNIEKHFSNVSELDQYIDTWMNGPYMKKRILLVHAVSYVFSHISSNSDPIILKYGTADWLDRLINLSVKRNLYYTFNTSELTNFQLNVTQKNLLFNKIKDVSIKFPLEFALYRYNSRSEVYNGKNLEAWVDQVVQFTNNKPTGAKSKNA